MMCAAARSRHVARLVFLHALFLSLIYCRSVTSGHLLPAGGSGLVGRKVSPPAGHIQTRGSIELGENHVKHTRNGENERVDGQGLIKKSVEKMMRRANPETATARKDLDVRREAEHGERDGIESADDLAPLSTRAAECPTLESLGLQVRDSTEGDTLLLRDGFHVDLQIRQDFVTISNAAQAYKERDVKVREAVIAFWKYQSVEPVSRLRGIEYTLIFDVRHLNAIDYAWKMGFCGWRVRNFNRPCFIRESKQPQVFAYLLSITPFANGPTKIHGVCEEMKENKAVAFEFPKRSRGNNWFRVYLHTPVVPPWKYLT